MATAPKKKAATGAKASTSESKKSGEKSGAADLGFVPTALQNVAGPLFQIATVVLPFVIVAVSKLYALFQKLPQNALSFLYGLIICFFGGTFPTLFAAIQAAKHGGRQTCVRACQDLSTEIMVIIEESKKVRE